MLNPVSGHLSASQDRNIESSLQWENQGVVFL